MNIVVVYSIIISMFVNFLSPRVDLEGNCAAAFTQVMKRTKIISCTFPIQDISVRISNIILHRKAGGVPDIGKTTPKPAPSKANKVSEFSIILDKYKIFRQHIVLPVFNEYILPKAYALKAGLSCFMLQRVYLELPPIYRRVAYFARSDTADILVYGSLFRFSIANPALKI